MKVAEKEREKRRARKWENMKLTRSEGSKGKGTFLIDQCQESKEEKE